MATKIKDLLDKKLRKKLNSFSIEDIPILLSALIVIGTTMEKFGQETNNSELENVGSGILTSVDLTTSIIGGYLAFENIMKTLQGPASGIVEDPPRGILAAVKTATILGAIPLNPSAGADFAQDTVKNVISKTQNDVPESAKTEIKNNALEKEIDVPPLLLETIKRQQASGELPS